MKLKLEDQNGVAVLTIREAIQMENIPVLKAGLTKLFKAGKTRLLLDLSGITDKDIPDLFAVSEIAGLTNWAHTLKCQLLVVASGPGLGDIAQISTRETSAKIFGTPLVNLLAKESAIRMNLQKLKAERVRIQSELGPKGAGAAELRKAKRENSDLKARIRALENQLRPLLKNMPAASIKDPLQPKFAVLCETLGKVMAKEGVL